MLTHFHNSMASLLSPKAFSSPCAFLQVNEPIIVACRIRCLFTVSAHHGRMCACTNVLLWSSQSFERPFSSSAKSGLRKILVQTSACQSYKGIMGLKFTSVIRKYQKGEDLTSGFSLALGRTNSGTFATSLQYSPLGGCFFWCLSVQLLGHLTLHSVW